MNKGDNELHGVKYTGYANKKYPIQSLAITRQRFKLIL